MSGYVVDASVAIKLFINDELSERSNKLFGLLAQDSEVNFYVPDHFFIECTNVLWKYVRWGGMSLEDAQANLADLAQLRLTVMTTASLMLGSLEWAYRYKISAYDASYLFLANDVGVPFVTVDSKLVRMWPGAVWLGDLSY